MSLVLADAKLHQQENSLPRIKKHGGTEATSKQGPPVPLMRMAVLGAFGTVLTVAYCDPSFFVQQRGVPATGPLKNADCSLEMLPCGVEPVILYRLFLEVLTPKRSSHFCLVAYALWGFLKMVDPFWLAVQGKKRGS